MCWYVATKAHLWSLVIFRREHAKSPGPAHVLGWGGGGVLGYALAISRSTTSGAPGMLSADDHNFIRWDSVVCPLQPPAWCSDSALVRGLLMRLKINLAVIWYMHVDIAIGR